MRPHSKLFFPPSVVSYPTSQEQENHLGKFIILKIAVFI